jgi:hypothetical protein
MRTMSLREVATPRPSLRCALAVSCGLACLVAAPASRAAGERVKRAQAPPQLALELASPSGGQKPLTGAAGAMPIASATLQQCLTTGAQSERSATLAGEMSAVPGTARMEMRINLLERVAGDTLYRTVTAPGLGMWRASAVGVKLFTSIDHVTNLAAPASYRGAVRFRWLNARGHQIKAEELRSPRCEQSALAPSLPLAPGSTAGLVAVSTGA